MGDISIFFVMQHIFVFGIIFWTLTFLGWATTKKKNHHYKKKFYECGFSSLDDIDITVDIKFLLVGVFLILYDVEFTFLFPFLFNIKTACYYSYMIFSLFIYLIIAALVYDDLNEGFELRY